MAVTPVLISADRRQAGSQRSTRKLRLLACGCYRRIRHLLTAASRVAVETAERHADHAATNAEPRAVQPDHIHGGSVTDDVRFVAAPSRLFRNWIESSLSYAAWAVGRAGPNHDTERRPRCDRNRAVISDARPSRRADAAQLTERLLGISGEDEQAIDRKYQSHVRTTLSTRFVILTNERPRFDDASGALAGRMSVLRPRQSFYGKEDPGLTDRLLVELPSIFNWAARG